MSNGAFLVIGMTVFIGGIFLLVWWASRSL